jgi:hypothetical protein
MSVPWMLKGTKESKISMMNPTTHRAKVESRISFRELLQNPIFLVSPASESFYELYKHNGRTSQAFVHFSYLPVPQKFSVAT